MTYLADLISGLSGAASAVAVAIALPLILRTVRPDAQVLGKTSIVSYGRPMKIIAAVFWCFWIAIVVLVFFGPPQGGLIVWSVVMGFLALVLTWHLEIFGVEIRFDDEEIQTRSPWRKRRRIPWTAVQSARFSAALQWYVIETNGSGRIRVHLYLSGVDSILAELKRRGIPVAVV